ncbi:transposase [candidate division FCPU426 bacterium]|nr:transposase [candidate division FCPU426 bacterium]
MGRPKRLKGADTTYHITTRTNGKKLFMKKKSDHKALCRCILKLLSKHNIICHAFTPMTNHFHMIIYIENHSSDLSQFMCELKTAYAKYYNHKYNMSGHFWGDRFKSTIIEAEKYLLACMRYIDRNPVKAGLVSMPGDWHYSSYHFYASGQNHPILSIISHPAYLSLSEDVIQRQELYKEFVNQPDALSDSLHNTMDKNQFLASDNYILNFKAKKL